MQLLGQVLKVCFVPPRFNNMEGIDNSREVTVIEGFSDFTYSEKAEEESSCRTK
jgi:hypothetical protein